MLWFFFMDHFAMMPRWIASGYFDKFEMLFGPGQQMLRFIACNNTAGPVGPGMDDYQVLLYATHGIREANLDGVPFPDTFRHEQVEI